MRHRRDFIISRQTCVDETRAHAAVAIISRHAEGIPTTATYSKRSRLTFRPRPRRVFREITESRSAFVPVLVWSVRKKNTKPPLPGSSCVPVVYGRARTPRLKSITRELFSGRSSYWSIKKKKIKNKRKEGENVRLTARYGTIVSKSNRNRNRTGISYGGFRSQTSIGTRKFCPFRYGYVIYCAYGSECAPSYSARGLYAFIFCLKAIIIQLSVSKPNMSTILIAMIALEETTGKIEKRVKTKRRLDTIRYRNEMLRNTVSVRETVHRQNKHMNKNHVIVKRIRFFALS